MEEQGIYFCGTDMYDCLHLNQKESSASTTSKIFRKPVAIPNCSLVEFTHFYSVYQQTSPENLYSWFINGLGLSETQIFGIALQIKEVAASKNSIVGLSEEGQLYRISLEADDNGELVCLKTSEVKHVDETRKSIPFKKICANDSSIYGLQSSSELSVIYKIASSLETVAEFEGKYIIEFSVGYGHFVALSDVGGLWNWGHCGRSELATNSDVNVMTVCEQPRRVEFFDDLPCIVVKVACGGWHTLALTSDGDVYSWGWNESGQLGHNSTVTSKSQPYPVDLGSAEDPVISIAAGSRHSVALLKSGKIFSWGRNREGQCGFGGKESSGEPLEIAKSWSGTAFNVKCGTWSTFINSK